MKTKTLKTINVLLWISQLLLSITFMWSGYMKIFKPGELPFDWVKDSADLVLFTGIIDLLAGIAIVIPTLLRVKTRLAIIAAYGIVFLMIAAIIFHISRGESRDIGFNIFILIISVFVIWGREKIARSKNQTTAIHHNNLTGCKATAH